MLGQAIGLLGAALSVVSMLQVDDRRFRRLALMAACIWPPHYWLLGAQVGMTVSALVALRQAISWWILGMPPRIKAVVGGLFILAFTAVTALEWRGWISVLPWLAGSVATSAYLRQGRVMRAQFLLTDSLWLLYGLMVGSIGVTATAVASLGANVRTIRIMNRFGRPDSSGSSGEN